MASAIANPAPRRSTVPLAAQLAVIVEFMVVMLLGIAYIALGGNWGFAFVGMLCAWITHLPFVARRARLLSLWGVLSLVVTIGCGVRGLLILGGYPSPEEIDAFFLRGNSFEDLVGASVTMVGVIAAVTVAYVLTTPSAERAAQEDDTRLSSWSLRFSEVGDNTIDLLVTAYALTGLFATFGYFRAVGGLEASISQRRTTYTGASDFASHGVLQFLAQTGVVALLLYLAYRLLDRRPLTPLSITAIALLAANAFAINWVTTTRADLLFVTLSVLLVIDRVRGKLNLVVVGLCGVLVLLGIGGLSAVRGGAETAKDGLSLAVGLESGLVNRNAVDLSKSLLITNAVPDTLPYENGKTIGTYVFAPVPRSVWPDKPVVSPGPTIGRTLYGLPQTGVPPGMPAELVWNFGKLAAIAGGAVFGFIFGRMDRWGRRRSPEDLTGLLIYALVLMPFGKAVMGVSVGQAFSAALQSLVLLVPLLMVGYLYNAMNSKHAHSPRPRVGAAAR